MATDYAVLKKGGFMRTSDIQTERRDSVYQIRQY